MECKIPINQIYLHLPEVNELNKWAREADKFDCDDFILKQINI